MSTNRGRGAVQIASVDIASINTALIQLQQLIDTASGLHGRVPIYDRAFADDPLAPSDVVTLRKLESMTTDPQSETVWLLGGQGGAPGVAGEDADRAVPLAWDVQRLDDPYADVLPFVLGPSVPRQDSITALTDSTSGTANDTLEAIPDPADTPITADALRDDLVANALPAIRNDFADLAAKVNQLLAALARCGVLS